MGAELQLVDTSVVANERWKLELSERVNACAEALDAYIGATDKLRSIWPNLCTRGDPSREQPFKDVVHAWMDEKCTSMKRAAGIVNHLGIDRKDLEGDAGVYRIRESGWSHELTGSAMYEAEPAAIARHVLATVDVDGFSKALSEAVSTHEETGFSDAAHKLGEELGLCSRVDWRRLEEKVIKTQKGRCLLEISNYGRWWFERGNSITKIVEVARTFEGESGVEGLSELLMKCAEKEEEAGSGSMDSRVPSRTRVEVEQGLSAVFFKEKVVLHIPNDVFTALLGFVREYVDTEFHRLVRLA